MTLPPKRRRLRRVLTALGICALLPFAAYLEEDWRGARAWETCRRELEAKGERLNLDDFIPPLIPDRQNLAMAPFFARILAYRTDPPSGQLIFGPPEALSKELPDMPAGGIKPSGVALAGPDSGHRTDLAAYQSFYARSKDVAHPDTPRTPAGDVLMALDRFAGTLDEITRSAADRPLSRFPINWKLADPAEIALPQFIIQQQLIEILALRASAYLANGQPDDAMRDVLTCLRLSHDAAEPNLLISYLVEVACLRFTLTPIWEGFATRQWSAVNLHALQNAFGRFDMLAGLGITLRTERAFSIKITEYIKQHPNRPESIKLMMAMISDDQLTSSVKSRLLRAVPKGWFDVNKAAEANLVQDYLIAAINPGAHRFSVERMKSAKREIIRLEADPVKRSLGLTFSVIEGVTIRGVRMQSMLDQAAVACALERFWSEHHVYPLHLDEICPAYMTEIPRDVVSGEPLHYSLTGNGRYQLYGVGWNGRDDGGQVAWLNSRQIDRDQGDWVWQYTDVQPPPPSKK